MTTHYYSPSDKKVNTIDSIRTGNPNSSIPEGADLSGLGYFPIVESPEPEYDRINQGIRYSIEETPTKRGVEYQRKWHLYDLSSETTAENTKQYNEALKASILEHAQKRLDSFAKTRDYDDIKSACSYYGSPVARFNSDAIDALTLRSNTWEAMYKLQNDIDSGVTTIPTSTAELELLLPILKWSN